MTEVTTRTTKCVGCTREFLVMDFENGRDLPLYCTPECEEEHSIFNIEQAVGGK